MKRRKPKSKGKRKFKGNPEPQPSNAPELVLTKELTQEATQEVERKGPANTVEALAETQSLAIVVETPTEIENATVPVEQREKVTESPTTIASPQVELSDIARNEEPQVQIEDSVAPAELAKETVDATPAVAIQSETGEPAGAEKTQVETATSAPLVEHRDDVDDIASTVELRGGEAEDLESILDIQVEVEDSSISTEVREAPNTVPPKATHSSTEIPTPSVATPTSKEKSTPPSAPSGAPRTSADRRAHPRYSFVAAIEVIAAAPDARIKSQVRDLSQQGCFVDTDTPLALGTSTSLRITKGATIFEAHARVVYNQAAKGMGLMFVAVQPQHLRTLDIWISESRESSWRALNRRRSQRVMMKVPVRVSGKAADGENFEVETHTLSISPHGALLVLAVTVQRGQRFILANIQTKSALECVVAHLEPSPGAPTQVGVEFSLPNPAFWRVAFPPKDWTPRHPDAKSR
jgi:hypothetical protein